LRTVKPELPLLLLLLLDAVLPRQPLDAPSTPPFIVAAAADCLRLTPAAADSNVDQSHV